MILTRKIKLHPSFEQKNILMDTLVQYKMCIQHCFQVGFQNKITSNSKLHAETYFPLRKKTTIQSQLVCSARTRAIGVLRSIKNNTKGKWNTKQPVVHKYPTICYYKNCCSYTGMGIKLSTSQGRIEIPLVHYPFIDGEWKNLKPTCQLQYKASKDEWYILALFDVISKPKTSGNEVLGIDRGIKQTAVLSNNQFVNSKHTRKIKSKYSHLRHRLAKKGTKSAKRLLKKISGKEHRFVKDANHCIAKMIINLPFDIFVLEQLSIRPKKRLGKSFNRRLMGWSWKQLEQFLTYKAELAGKKVEYVDARYTSQKCSRCDHIKRSSRRGILFKCAKCGFQLHADLNAARNIKNNFFKTQNATSILGRAISTVQTSQSELCSA
ncbi:hypothetical protein LCGC14_1538420 [marine sediment metagenome]|uniref:Transposase IS891/IS1136/IS1341 domain-containing protein n=1 Tax=marine sediment metagenome TaxID=412755 RepID=A0A0F9L9T4_9ZZZZ